MRKIRANAPAISSHTRLSAFVRDITGYNHHVKLEACVANVRAQLIQMFHRLTSIAVEVRIADQQDLTCLIGHRRTRLLLLIIRIAGDARTHRRVRLDIAQAVIVHDAQVAAFKSHSRGMMYWLSSVGIFRLPSTNLLMSSIQLNNSGLSPSQVPSICRI